ncbi:hypothetical protein B0O80DRAFT_468947, partial [Mortierella sp. GBAus27b]
MFVWSMVLYFVITCPFVHSGINPRSKNVKERRGFRSVLYAYAYNCIPDAMLSSTEKQSITVHVSSSTPLSPPPRLFPRSDLCHDYHVLVGEGEGRLWSSFLVANVSLLRSKNKKGTRLIAVPPKKVEPTHMRVMETDEAHLCPSRSSSCRPRRRRSLFFR